MNCKMTSELLPAYVLGALERDETAEVEAHLRAGREHDDELVELRATVFALDRYGDARSLEAPRQVRSGSASPLAAVSNAVRSVWSVPAWRTLSVAAMALAIFGAGWFVAGAARDGSKHNVYVSVRAPGGQAIALSADTSEERVAVTMTGFEALPADRVYQLWAIRNDTWLRVGVCKTSGNGGWTGEFPFKLRPDDRIAMTVEAAGGSDVPTTEPLLISSS